MDNLNLSKRILRTEEIRTAAAVEMMHFQNYR